MASLGTALTPEQARLISRYAGEVVIAYDNDGAGQKAAQRAIGILENLDLKVKVLRMTGAKDPDEFIKAKGADAFKNLLEQSENHVEYRLQSAMGKYNMEVDEEKVAALKEAVGVIASLPNAVEREVYSMRVAEKCGVNKSVVTDEVERARRKKIYYAKKQQEKDILRASRMSQPRDKAIRYENERSALAEEGVIRLMYLDSGLFTGVKIEPEEFSSPLLGRFFHVLRDKAQAHAPLSMASLSASFTPEEIDHLTALLQKPEVLSNGQKALGDYINIIRTEKQNSSAEDDLLAFAEQMRNRKGYGGHNGC